MGTTKEIPVQAPPQILASEAALALIAELRAEYGEILFHQSGGCCDGSSPMCYPRSEFLIGDRDVRLGEVGGAPFYISRPQFEYWKHTQLMLEVVPGQGGMFSLDNGRGVRFLVRSRLFTEAEIEALRRAGRFGPEPAGASLAGRGRSELPPLPGVPPLVEKEPPP